MAVLKLEDGARPSQAHYVLSRFGEVSDVVEKTRFNQRTVYYWLSVGAIPEKNWLALLVDAYRSRVPLTPLDFVAHLSDAVAEARVTGDIAYLTSGESPASSATPA